MSTEKIVKLNEVSNFLFAFKGSCLIQDRSVFTRPNIVIFSLVYKLDTLSRDLIACFTRKHCFYVGIKVTKNPNPDRYSYLR